MAASQLMPGQTYFFTVTAYNNQGDESSFPNEVVYTVPGDTTGSSGTTITNLYDIYMSTSLNLFGAVPLNGTSVDWDIYVFTVNNPRELIIPNSLSFPPGRE